MRWANNLELLSNAATATAAVIAVGIAWAGLGTWRQQLKWENDHELARKILLNLFLYRDALKQLSNSWMSAAELNNEALTISKSKSDDVRHYEAKVYAYDLRWKNVINTRACLHADLVEAEVLWEANTNELLDPLRVYETKVYAGLEQLLMSENPKQPERNRLKAKQRFDEKYEKFIWPELHYDVEQSTHLDQAVDAIQSYLSQKLSR